MVGKKSIQKNWRTYVLVISGLVLYLALISVFLYTSFEKQNDLYDTETELIILQYHHIMADSILVTNNISSFIMHQTETSFEQEDLETFLSTQNLDNYGIEYVLFAPDAVIEYIYPMETQEHLIGLNLLDDIPEFASDIINDAIIDKTMIIHSRRETQVGIYGVVLRKPIYHLDGNFYGILTIVIAQDYVEEEASVKENYYFNNSLFDDENVNIIGSLQYDEDFDKYEQLAFERTKLFVGMNLSDEYSKQIIYERIFIIFVLTILYTITTYFALSYFYRSEKTLKKMHIDLITDDLTKLFNRNKLKMDAKALIKLKKEFTIVLGDLSNFKDFNDLLGHSIGDKFLIEIARIYTKILNRKAKVYRWGGDEFIVLINSSAIEKIQLLISTLINELNNPITIDGIEYSILMKMGITSYPRDGKNLEDLIKVSDNIIHNLHSTESIQIRYSDDTVKENILLHENINKMILSDLNDYFQVYLQPIVKVENNEIYGFEALLRIFDEDNTQLDTQKVINYLEKSGKISLIDRFVFSKVTEYCKTIIKGKKFLNISFNISALSLNNDFISYIEKTVNEGRCNPKILSIEITETIRIKSFELASTYLNRLKNLGIKIVLDDFGTGYSSLYYISMIPLSTIKIDKKFIQSSVDNLIDRKLVEVIVSLSKAMDILVIAEGVESKAQLDVIRDLYCDLYQGYLFSKALSYDDTIKLIKNCNPK